MEPSDRQTIGKILDGPGFRVEYIDGSPSTRDPKIRINE